MIILLGPDATGKTTLAKQLEVAGLKYYHFTKDSNYLDYITPLCSLDFTDAVLDRHALCEYPYSLCMKRPFKFKMKEWHNIILMTLIQNPVIVLCIHKPNPLKYDESQYLPFELWDDCLYHYIHYLTSNHIRYIIYDYMAKGTSYVEYLLGLNKRNNAEIEWWLQDWEAGYGCTGSSHPKFLLVAERIGPNNVHNIPFETGPTGYMLTDMLSETGTPLGSIAITNMVKSFRNDKRQVNADDVASLSDEITNLKPQKVIFMGTPAKRGVPVAKSLGCDVGTMVHLGALNHKGVKDMSGYHNEWKKMLGMLPVVRYKES